MVGYESKRVGDLVQSLIVQFFHILEGCEIETWGFTDSLNQSTV